MLRVTPGGKIKMVDDARGWGISGDIAQLLLAIAPGVKAEAVRKALAKIK